MDLSGKTFAELRAEFVALGNQLSIIAGKRREMRARLAKALKR